MAYSLQACPMGVMTIDYQLGGAVSLVFMAFAIGMDAFSVSLGLGMQEFRLKRIAFIGLFFGLFHTVLPLIGIVFGKLITAKVGYITTLIGGLLLVGIGAHMIFSALSNDEKESIQPYGMGLFLLALTVSIDSFSVGLGLGLSGAKIILTLVLFGGVNTVLTWIGMLLGRKVRGFLGIYSEMLGGSILCSFGLYIIFS